MHEAERHRVILAAVETAPVATVAELVEITGTSEATIRRDIAALDSAGRLRRVWGGAESLTPKFAGALAGRPFRFNQTVNVEAKRAIARAAVDLCDDGEPIIINGGTTTFQMVHGLVKRRMQVFTNSFPIAETLLHHSENTVLVPGGSIYREQNIILSPFENDTTANFSATKMFMSCRGVSPHGILEGDPMLIQAELKLIRQAHELIILADSSKFTEISSLILCGLDRVNVLITDNRVRDEDLEMLAAAGVKTIVAEPSSGLERKSGAA